MSQRSDALLLEAQRTDYGLRSTFFYRKLNELGFMGFSAHIAELVSVADAFQWERRVEWGISETAWYQVISSGISPLKVFSHPMALIQNPRRLAYYRNVAAISQKGAKVLGVRSIERYESGTNPDLSEQQAILACQLFNRHVSSIIDSTISFTDRDVDALLLASAGAQIDGAWRNAIGKEAEALVKHLIITEFSKHSAIRAFETRLGRTVPFNDIEASEIVMHLADFRGFILPNGTAVLFSSEPDVSLRLADGKLDTAIEVKGGKDTAGAIERFSAAQKSFLRAQEESPFVHTILVASCITPEVENRIADAQRVNRLFHEIVNLSELLASEDSRSQFAQSLLSRLDALPAPIQ